MPVLPWVNVDEENLQIFRTIEGILIKFSGKMCLMIISKILKNSLQFGGLNSLGLKNGRS